MASSAILVTVPTIRAPSSISTTASSPQGGRFDFDDGGTYCGGWEDGKAHGHGVCTGPKGQGEFSGHWNCGFEVSGVYAWPTGSAYEGQWQDGKRHGLGVETRGRWIYRGEWTAGFKGRYGVRQSITSAAKYNGTWANGLQDGYGSETYADGGTFQGQWAKGMRHGYGVRTSAPFGLAAHTRPKSARRSPSMSTDGAPPAQHDRRLDDCRGGFVLKDNRANAGTLGRTLVDAPKGSPLKVLIPKPKRSTGSTPWQRRSFENMSSMGSESEGRSDESDVTDSSFVSQDEVVEPNVIETYMGEWKNDKRCGFGIAERSDGFKYEGEWYNNRKFGYGITTFKNGQEEQGKYKNNVLVSSGSKKHLFLIRSAKCRERIEAAVNAAHRASQIALQKADIAISRTATARGKAEQADIGAKHAREDSDIARLTAKRYAPEFQQPGTELLKRKLNTSARDSPDFGPQLHVVHDLPHQRSRSLYVGNSGARDALGSSREAVHYDFEETRINSERSSPPPAQSALLDVFRNNPDRRPSAAGFLRRPSTINFRRPSTVVELKLTPSAVEQRSDYYPKLTPSVVEQRSDYYTNNPYRHRYVPDLNPQQVVDDHLGHYYETVSKPPRRNKLLKQFVNSRNPVQNFSDLNAIYGLPTELENGEMEEEEEAPVVNQRRSTMPTVLDPNCVPSVFNTEHDGMVRTSSLYKSPRKTEATKTVVNARKNSLPDISKPGSEPLLTREAIAALSSQRREAIRRQEEEAERLKANPLLYLVNPNLWDWISSQQLLILVVLINVGLAVLFFKVIL